MIVAIDGTVSSGKSTIARKLAHKIGFTYLNTGAIYRAFTIKILDRNMQNAAEDELVKLAGETEIDMMMNEEGKLVVFMDGNDVSSIINTPQISQNVATYAKIVGIRKCATKIQKRIANSCDCVVEGRDIGTVVFPDAELKIFMTADVKVRAQRRLNDYLGMGKNYTLEEVVKEIESRDKADMEREVSPLKPSEDAIVYYNNGNNIEKVLEELSGMIFAVKQER